MDENNIKKSTGYKKLIIAAVLIFVAVFSLFGGFYYGVWVTGQRQFDFSVQQIIKDAPSYLDEEEVDINLFWRVWEAILTKYVEQPVNEEGMFYGALEGLVKSVEDPYSIFLDPEATNEFVKELSGSFEGIGAEIGIKNNQLTIISPLDDSPAFNAGLKPGDKILAIDDQETIDMGLDQAISLIRGKKGTTVILTILTKESQEIKDISIKRDVIKVESVAWELKDGDIAYIKIVHFDSDTYNDFNKIANEVLLSSPQGIILDLRNNPGGYLNSAIDVAGEFLEDKIIVTEDFGETQKEYKSKGTAKLKDIKTVVLVNGGSASASEIVAGALQDYQHATIIGEQTFGKGTVQDYEQFPDGSSLKLTVAKWLTPGGKSINDQGIRPDVEVDLTFDDYDNNRDPQLEAAYLILNE